MSAFGLAPSSAFKIRSDDALSTSRSTKKSKKIGLAMKSSLGVESTPIKVLSTPMGKLTTQSKSRKALGELSHAKMNMRQSIVPHSAAKAPSSSQRGLGREGSSKKGLQAAVQVLVMQDEVDNASADLKIDEMLCTNKAENGQDAFDEAMSIAKLAAKRSYIEESLLPPASLLSVDDFEFNDFGFNDVVDVPSVVESCQPQDGGSSFTLETSDDDGDSNNIF